LKIISKIILKLTGWKIIGGISENIPKCVIIAAPHTSNWDLFYGRLGLYKMGVKLRFLIKKEVFFFPFNILLKSIGGIPVDRSKNHNMVDAMSNLFKQRNKLHLMFAPEGTRKQVDYWKTGFYHVACQANVPIALGFIDYSVKVGGIVSIIYPTGNLVEDLKSIENFYMQFTGKYPQKIKNSIIHPKYLS